MATSPKRGIAEEKERAVSTVPTQKWWVSALLWVAVALGTGVVYRLTAPVFGTEGVDRWMLLRLAATLILNVVAMYGISYYAARQTLARRSLREIWNSPSNRDALNRFGLPVLLSIAGLAVLVASNAVTESLYQGLLAASTLFSIYRALTTAYTAHYFDYVVSPRESREYVNDREIKGKNRLFWERAAVTAGLSYPRQRLVFPLLQTILVAFGLQALLSAALMAANVGYDDTAVLYWLGALAPALPVISVVLWALWHLHGGIGKILRLSSGRPMKSFGWQHPELSGTAK
jgi:hypothetical protein